MDSKSIYTIEFHTNELSNLFGQHTTTHSDQYTNLVLSNLQNPPEKNFERHHYVPRYDNGTKHNIVKLSYYNHMWAHALLCLHYMEIGDKERARNNGAAVNKCKGKSSFRKKTLASLSKDEIDQLCILHHETQLIVRQSQLGENNHFYGRTHPPEDIEIKLRKLGKSGEGVSVLKQERPLELAIFAKTYSNDRCDTIFCILKETDQLCRIKHGEFDPTIHDYVPRERVMESVFRKNSGRSGLPRSDEHINKINKDPEKIRKTAEKHRGMKRTEEAKQKMSDAKKGKPSNIKGSIGYFHPETKDQIFIIADDPIPEGYIKGNIKTRGRTYYDPITHECHRYPEGDQPEGWINGVPPGKGNRRGGVNKYIEEDCETHRIHEEKQDW